MRIGIIGGGMAGLTAAIAMQQTGMEILLLDANTTLGKKLSATGSGRCNISNQAARADTYSTDDRDDLEKCFKQIPQSKIISFLDTIGIPTRSSEDGWIYPLSYSAANVVNILEDNLHGTQILRNRLITHIKKEDGHFILSTDDPSNTTKVDRVIIACGSPANPQLGARDVLYDQFKELGHHILAVKPALTPLETDTNVFHKLQGVRLDAQVTLKRNRETIVQNTGNIIFTKWGLNGPGVMDISHLIDLDSPHQYTLQIHFAPYSYNKIQEYLTDPARTQFSPHSILKAFLPAKIVHFILAQVNLNNKNTCQELSDTEKKNLLHAIENQEVGVRAVRGFKHAQASCGGIPLAEINPLTMESCMCKGLFFAGEILNVLGPCGGFNLHWAILSGIIAAQGATTLDTDN